MTIIEELDVAAAERALPALAPPGSAAAGTTRSTVIGKR